MAALTQRRPCFLFPPTPAFAIVACCLENSSQSPLANKATRRLQEAAPAEEDCGSSVIQWGDGVCDARLNNELCNFDGGDCCAQTCVQTPLYPESCLYFDCVDPDIGADVSTEYNVFTKRLADRPSVSHFDP